MAAPMMRPTPARPLHPVHAILLGFPIAFFSGALVFDIVYLNSAEVQWTNFSSWLITGALLIGGPVLLWALIDTLRIRPRRWLIVILLAAMWLLGLVNAFKHSADGWASVGTTGLLLSIMTTTLALVAGWVAYSGKVR